MTIDKEQLKALAEASLVGDWYESGDLRYEDRKTGDVHGLHHDDDRFIASANPATILALLAEIERDEIHLRAFGSVAETAIAERDQLKAESEKMRNFLAEVSRTSGDKWAVMAARNLLREFGHD